MTQHVIGKEGIEHRIPHRSTMLLVDRVTHMDLDARTVHAELDVTADKFFFDGHFPGHPIMPGVLVVEALAQSAGVMINTILGRTAADSLFYFVALDDVRFRNPVLPGVTLQLEVRQLRQKASIYMFEAVARVEGKVAAEAKFTAKILERPQP